MDKLPPAPWTAEQDDEEAVTGEWTIKDSDGGYVAAVSNPYVIFDMQVAYANDPSCQLESIAKLLAAAPELLEVLSWVRAHYASGPTKTINDRIDAVLAKATA